MSERLPNAQEAGERISLVERLKSVEGRPRVGIRFEQWRDELSEAQLNYNAVEHGYSREDMEDEYEDELLNTNDNLRAMTPEDQIDFTDIEAACEEIAHRWDAL